MTPLPLRLLRFGLIALLAACSSPLEPAADEMVASLPASVPEPPTNRTTPAKVDLGRLLFWDPILSGARDTACATCHHPELAYSDGIALSVGTGGTGLGPKRVVSHATAHRTPRNSMTVLDTAWNGVVALGPFDGADAAPMFWDSRVRSLEEQALRPILARDEMRGDVFAEKDILPEIMTRLSGIPDYVRLFEAAFGADSISQENLGRAIATFERTLVARDSSFDRFMSGDDDALTFAQKRGLFAFVQARCSNCHSGPMFSDFELHRLDVPDLEGTAHDDGDGAERFRTPSLRNVMRTAPYMHNGRFGTIHEVLDDFYFHVDHGLDPDLDGVDCPNDKDGATLSDIEAFLWSISDGTFDERVPSQVPSGLPVGGELE